MPGFSRIASMMRQAGGSTSVGAVFVFAVSAAMYLGSLGNSLVMDDIALLSRNDFIASWSNVRLLFDSLLFSHVYPIDGGARPLTLLSYMADYRLWDGAVAGFHATNVVLHGLAAMFLFLVLATAVPGLKRAAACMAALLFALHPVQAEAVNVITFRADSLMTVFYLAALLLMARALNAVSHLRFLFFAAIGAGLFAAALLAKEAAVTFPLAFGAYAWIFHDARPPRRRAIGLIALCGLMAPVFFRFFWLRRFSSDYAGVAFPSIGNGTSPLSSMSAYINVLAASFLHNLKAAAWPLQLSVDYSIRLLGTPVNGTTVAAAVIAAAAVAALVLSKNRAVKLGLALAIIAYVPVSNIVPLPNTVADRYLYLPFAGLALAAMALVSSAASRWRVAAAGWLISCLVVGACAGLTAQRNRVFCDLHAVYADAVRKTPGSARARYNFALAEIDRGSWQTATSELEQVMRLNPVYRRDEVWRYMGICYRNLGDIESAESYFRRLLAVRTDKTALNDYAGILWQTGRVAEAEKILEESIRVYPDADAFNNLGTIYVYRKEYGKAAAAFQTALRLNPGCIEARMNLFQVYGETGTRDIPTKSADPSPVSAAAGAAGRPEGRAPL